MGELETTSERPWAHQVPPIDPSWFVRPSGYDASRSIHGVAHARRVWTHALALADAVGMEPWQRDALHYAAMWHDIGRTDDGADYYHGAKSAGKVVALGLHRGVEPLVYETALYAITHHCGDEVYGERAAARLWYFVGGDPGGFEARQVDPAAAAQVFRALKDADALDRVRLGDLDPSHLRFAESHNRVQIAWSLLREMRDR